MKFYKPIYQNDMENTATKTSPEGLYLDLLKKTVMNTIYEDIPLLKKTAQGVEYLPNIFDRKTRLMGNDYPSVAHTMIGHKRLNNIQYCMEQVIMNNVPGDMIETGVWRGGASIFMRGVLKAYNITDRIIWVADSFEGMPKPDAENYPIDVQCDLTIFNSILNVPMETVKRNFALYELHDDQVKFLKGWFKDTLPEALIEQLSVMRLDGDYYESTSDALKYLYPKLSPGGFVIVDDYHVLPPCEQAISDFRGKHKITDKIIDIDTAGIFWQKTL